MYDLGNQFRMNQDDLKVYEKSSIMGEKFRIQVLIPF